MSPSRALRRERGWRRAGGLLLAALLCWPALACAAGESTVVFLVRHAEKSAEADDPALTDQGLARADELAAMLRDAGITTVHSTDFRRTRDTARPVAEQYDLPIRIYHWDDMEALAEALRTEDGRHLVVGHSDTTPELVEVLGGDPGVEIDEKDEYDRLYVVTLAPDGTVTTVLMRYGL
jgi:broad specificity phosphatase PhoE